MNYRHQFHAGNFADVMKHALLIQLLRGLQKKEKGFLYLDTHAGRGRYDLEVAATGNTLARKPEWPDGIGRLWSQPDASLPQEIAEYLTLVRDCDVRGGNLESWPRFYPGSPWIARQLARDVDRLALYEKQPAECAALRQDFFGVDRVSVHELDGYGALRSTLPPPERRALVLIDPPYEAQDEFIQVIAGLKDGLRRFPSGVFAVWYPLTWRARVDEFFVAVSKLDPPPAITCELAIAGEASALKMKGCGLLVLNPPWQFERAAESELNYLADRLAQAPGGGARVKWLVPEKQSSPTTQRAPKSRP